MSIEKLPKYIIYDWDGTIADSYDLLLMAHNCPRKAFDLPEWSMEEYKGKMASSARELYPKLYGDQAEQALELLYDFVENNHMRYTKPLDTAEELLSFVQNLNIPQLVVSNKRHKYLLREAEGFGWTKYFVSILGAGEAKKDKPAADPAYLAFKRQKIDLPQNKQDIWFIGDTTTDILCSKAFGSRTIIIDKIGDVERYDNVLYLNSLKELLNMIESLDCKK